MADMNVVLDDNLYQIYHLFKNREDEFIKDLKTDKISKILHFSGNSVLTNLAQIDRLGLKIDGGFRNRLNYMKSKRHSLTELSKSTIYKIVLTDDTSKKDFPYVNIDGDQIEMVLGGFVMRNQSREKAIDHLKSLCADAWEIILYDRFFAADVSKENQNIDILKNILPDSRNITIYYHKRGTESAHISEEGVAKLSNDRPRWTLQDKLLDDNHDRYIIINNQIEIILTSGFDYLSNTGKEISYIVRNYSNRFQI